MSQISPSIGSARIETDDAKVKSLKPRSKIIKKNMKSHLAAAKLTSNKETGIKSKLRKNDFPTEKYTKDIGGIVKTESKETFPNTSDGTLETKMNELSDFNKSGPFCNTSKLDSIEENYKEEEQLSKLKTKSQLSLKSKAYMRTTYMNKNLQSHSGSSLDNIPRFSGSYHRHSLPQRPSDMASSMYHFTPSTNYTIPSSEEKLSGRAVPINQNLSMNVLSPVPFEKGIHSSSFDEFNTLDNANYISYPKECLGVPGSMFSHTTPLPNMAQFNKGVSYSPDFNMTQYPYYNINTGSSGRISANSDHFQAPSVPLYYEPSVGKSWPKISQPIAGVPDRYATLPQNYRHRNTGRVSTKESDQQKRKYLLDFHRILLGKDKRTSLMIRNIPNKYNQVMLTQELDEKHQGLYDYVYLPIDPKNKCNCGYAFINVVHPVIILSLYMEFNGKGWKNFNSEKICELTYGRLQGKDQLLKQLEGSGVMQQSDSAKKPLILDTVQPSEELLEKIKAEFMSTYEFS